MTRRLNARLGILALPAAALLTALVALCIPADAEATAAPDMPLPPCMNEGGVRTGACPAESDAVAGSGAGRFTAGGSVQVITNPRNPVCSTWDKYADVWSPSPCFARVSAPRIVSCATIDLRNGKQFRELACNLALYKTSQSLPSPLFTMRRPGGVAGYDGRTACGDTPDFNTFVYGGPYTVTPSIWTSRGGSALACEVTFAGPRPNGLYGPTWVKMSVEIGSATTGGSSSVGASKSAEFYVPIDGDLRYDVDVDVTATATIQDADWDNGRVLAVYRATLSNRGGAAAENAQLTIGLPKHVRYQSTSDTSCTPTTATTSPIARGGTVTCTGLTIAPGSFRMFEIVVRVVNATDLDGLQNGELEGMRGVEFDVRVENDTDTTNNTAVAKLDIPFRTGSYGETKTAMQTLIPYFNYQTDIYHSQCNVYKDDIWKRLEQIHAQHPEVFANLSYGGITSGEYDLPLLGKSDGHVGVVVYTKGTHYRRTGIIISGTPSASPLSGESLVGPAEEGSGFAFNGATSDDGRYLRTAADKFPGFPKEESGGGSGDYGFEGRYGYNAAEFGGGTPEPAPAGVSCPFVPDAVVVTTESPVEILVTNSRGQRVETQDGKILKEELDGGIHSMAFPHVDGTYGWTLVLPPDEYDVQLRGTRAGSYKLTLTTFAPDGTPNAVVTSGVTTPGQVDQYAVDAPVVVVTPAPQTPAPPSVQPTGGGGGGGGGALDLLALLSMGGVLGLRLARRSVHRAG